MVDPDGTRREGEWRNGNRHGPGMTVSPDGSIINVGVWRNGVRVRASSK